MSQRTRNHTTAADTSTAPKAAGHRSKKRSETHFPATPHTQEALDAPLAAASAFAPEALARTLRAVAAELERDPDLARRVAQALQNGEDARDGTADALSSSVLARVATGPNQQTGQTTLSEEGSTRLHTFTPRLVTGTTMELGTGIPDPFTLYTRLGEDSLRVTLAGLRLGTLRAIIRVHRLDQSGKLARQNDAEKLRAAILTAVRRDGASRP